MDYLAEFRGRFVGVMRWDDYRDLMTKLADNPQDWFLYDTTASLPSTTLPAEKFISEIEKIKAIITEQHQEKYCGIVYVDDLQNPSFVKIFHPNNLGKSCGSSEHPPIPQWLLSKNQPLDVVKAFGAPEVKQGFISKYLKF